MSDYSQVTCSLFLSILSTVLMSHHITRIIPEQLEHRSRRHIFVGDRQRLETTRYRYRYCHFQHEMFTWTTAVHSNANNECKCATLSLHFMH